MHSHVIQDWMSIPTQFYKVLQSREVHPNIGVPRLEVHSNRAETRLDVHSNTFEYRSNVCCYTADERLDVHSIAFDWFSAVALRGLRPPFVWWLLYVCFGFCLLIETPCAHLEHKIIISISITITITIINIITITIIIITITITNTIINITNTI